jgi:hypothetical protein
MTSKQFIKKSGAKGKAEGGDRAASDSLPDFSAYSRRGEEMPSMSVERAETLASSLVPCDGDDAAAALIELVTAIAYEGNPLQRDMLAIAVVQMAYRATKDFSNAATNFAARAVSAKSAQKRA